MLIAHRVELDPTDRQRTAFARAAGTARFAYNWALAEWKRRHAARERDKSLPAPSEMALRRDLNAAKRSLYPWMLEVTKCAVQEAVIDFGAAFRSFLDKQRTPLPASSGAASVTASAPPTGSARPAATDNAFGSRHVDA